VIDFICNLCGARNCVETGALDRESPSCSGCGSSVRTRGLMLALSMELFGVRLTVAEFPRVKSLRGIGTSDANQYAAQLVGKLDYRNTFYDREPRFDLANPAASTASGVEVGTLDFIISSEVFEHVPPPVERAFENAARLLKPNGVLIMTVPYSLEASMREHYPDLHEFGFATVGGEQVLVNRSKTGEIRVFEHPVFHRSGNEGSLEVREFNETDLVTLLRGAGFRDVKIYSENCPEFGIMNAEPCSLPIAVRKGDFAFSRESAREVVEEWRGVKQKHDAEMQRLLGSYWFRIGRKLGLC
jgi:SAM-dependent methyltransferase